MDYSDVAVRPIRDADALAKAIEISRHACEDFHFDYRDFFEKYPESLWWGLYVKGEMVGAIRVIVQSPAGLPVYAEGGWPELAKDVPANSCELAMVSVAKEYRGQRRLFLPLYAAFYGFCLEQGIEYVYAILNRIGWWTYKRIGIEFEQCGEEKLYWNDPSFPVQLRISELTTYVKEHRPELWAMGQKFAKTGSFAPGP